MKKIKIETEFDVYDTISELAMSVQNLIKKATEAREKAYAPYSQFLVGAALELENGEIILGNNQENAIGSGVIARRAGLAGLACVLVVIVVVVTGRVEGIDGRPAFRCVERHRIQRPPKSHWELSPAPQPSSVLCVR
jgi:hypothetical protein